MTAENRGAKRKPPKGKPFEKGKSGNPGGRPKTPPEVKDALKALTAPAITRLENIIKFGGDEAAVVRAINTVLDRNLGRAPDAPSMDPFENMTEEQLVEAVRKELENRVTSAGGTAVDQ